MRSLFLFCLSIFFLLILGSPIHAQQEKLKAISKADDLATSQAAFDYLDSIQKKGGLDKTTHVLLLEKLAVCALEINDIKALSTICINGIKKSRAIQKDSLEAFFYKFLAISQVYNSKLAESVQNFKKSASIAKAGGYHIIEATNYNNIGGTLIDLKRMEEAEDYLLKSIDLSTQNGLPSLRNKLLSYRLLATLYDLTNRSEKSNKIYEEVHKGAVLLKDTNLICSNMVFHAQYLKTSGQLDAALKKTEEALKMIEKYGDQQSLLTALIFHSNNLTDAKRYKEANELKSKIIDLNKKLYKTESQQQINELETKFKTKEIEQDKNVAEATVQIENQRKNLYLFILLTVLSLSIVGLLLLYSRNLKKQNRAKELLQTARLTSLIEGQENERTRIAKELHDGIVQDLTALQINMNATEKINTQTVADEIDRISVDLRNISYEMMPLTLKKFGLIESFKDLFERSLTKRGISFEFEHFGLEERLPEKIEVSVYRICQELINNALKHSEASMISVVLRKNANQLSFIFEDNGKGFEFATVNAGIGLNSLQSRIENIKGNLEFDTKPNQGTTAFIQIPI